MRRPLFFMENENVLVPFEQFTRRICGRPSNNLGRRAGRHREDDVVGLTSWTVVVDIVGPAKPLQPAWMLIFLSKVGAPIPSRSVM